MSRANEHDDAPDQRSDTDDGHGRGADDTDATPASSTTGRRLVMLVPGASIVDASDEELDAIAAEMLARAQEAR
ncbi:MAG: hypothetical protein KF809_09465 [Chloroflexi bacterium]|nr:hypothetical protein [Chloroflexota bacterium]